MEPQQTAGAASRGGLANPRGGQGRRLLGDVMVEMGLVSREDVELAVEAARPAGRLMGEELLARKALSSDQLTDAIATRFGIPRLRLNEITLDLAAVNLLDSSTARRLRAVPVAFLDARTALVAVVDPTDVVSLDDVRLITGRVVRPGLVSPGDLNVLLGQISRLDSAIGEVADDAANDARSTEPIAPDPSLLVDDAPAVKLVRSIIAQAVEQGASDVHLDPTDGSLRIRFRIDGVTHDVGMLPASQASGVVSRLKILAEMDIAERRVPQDGRVGLTIYDRKVDLRVVVLPVVNGESVVLRILDTTQNLLSLDDIGLTPESRARLERGLRQPSGFLVATGPTGAGKTTTLYAGLAEINTPEKTIITIEDPVESRVPGVKQVQVNLRTGLTFATGLRSMMRADPDVLMVGEIRDGESAGIAVQAAVTGHLVLSTLHTNDAPGAINRLIDMGVPAFLVASSLTCVVAQRLARKLCADCKVATTVPGTALGLEDDTPVSVFESRGCGRCVNTGYRGRVGVYEVMMMSEALRDLAVEHAPTDAIRRQARKEGMVTLREDGMEKVAQGLTALDEIRRVVPE